MCLYFTVNRLSLNTHYTHGTIITLNFLRGTLHLYERKGLHGQILKIHIEHNNVDAALDTCRQFGPQDPNLWIQALQLIGNVEGEKVKEKDIEEILQVISQVYLSLEVAKIVQC